jgi:hypothetical protein
MAKGQMSKGLESQTKPPIHSTAKAAATGNVSDIPMNHPECKKAGGTWSETAQEGSCLKRRRRNTGKTLALLMPRRLPISVNVARYPSSFVKGHQLGNFGIILF